MDNNNKTDEMLEVQVTCKFSIDNQRNGYFDLINDAKHTDFTNQLQFYQGESTDKIFHDTVEELNLAKLYLEGFDVTIAKYGKRNVFYESDEEPTDKTDKSTTSSEDSDDSECEETHGGLVQKFVRTVFENLVSAKDCNFMFSIGWTEINEHNQFLDLLNGHCLVQCHSMHQLLEALTIGLNNRNSNNTQNILSIVLEQQWIHLVTRQPLHCKISTVNFCDLNSGADRSILQNIEPPMNFCGQPMPSLPPYMMMPPPSVNYFSPPPIPPEFAFFNGNPHRPAFDPPPPVVMVQQQSNKLLKNAEILFSKLNLNEMNDAQRKEIQEWMYLKTECDNFVPSPRAELPPSYFGNSFMNPPVQPPPAQQQTSLLPIIEMDETNDDPNEDEMNENDSECESFIDINDQSNNLFAKISDKMSSFRDKADDLVREKSSEYFDNNPRVLSSGQSDARPADLQDEAAGGMDLSMSTSTSMSEQYLAKTGRRRSIRDNNNLNSDEMELIRKAALASSLESEVVKESADSELMTKLDELRKSLKKSVTTIDNTNMHIKELETTIALRKDLKKQLLETSKTRQTAKKNCNKKETKYQKDYEKTKKDLQRAQLNNKSEKEVQRLKDLKAKFEEKLQVLTGINEIAATSAMNKKVKECDKLLEEDKSKLEKANRVLRKEIEHKKGLEKDISKQLKLIENASDSNKKIIVTSPSSATCSKNSDKVKIRDVDARLNHLDEILKEKSSNLQNFSAGGAYDNKEKDSLRYEIRNLRRTRDSLLDQRISLAKKLKRDKMLSNKEERKMLECDEAIMAIDDVIELKNELICGHKSIDSDEKMRREKGWQLLMAGLNKLPQEEMRVLLHKYFNKVIDLKESCKKLELDVMELERKRNLEREAWEWREDFLKNAMQRTRLEGNKNLLVQQKNYEDQKNLLLRHFANATANSSLNDVNFDTTSNSGAVAVALPTYEDLNIMKGKKSRDYITKFQVTRYHQQGGSSMTVADKHAIMIPPQNLKQLMEKKPENIVTREKNKLIIQQQDKN